MFSRRPPAPLTLRPLLAAYSTQGESVNFKSRTATLIIIRNRRHLSLAEPRTAQRATRGQLEAQEAAGRRYVAESGSLGQPNTRVYNSQPVPPNIDQVII